MTGCAETTWPQVVEIEVNRHCNRRCEYCPNSLPTASRAPIFMEPGLFRRIIGMLRDIAFTGRLSFHLFNEPLLRRDLDDLVAWARAALPRAHVVLYTNGDLLSDKRHEQLIQAGIDLFLVTRHDWDAYPDRPFQRVQMPGDFAVSSRGGHVVSVDGPLDIACFGPTEMLIVTHAGDVLLCHEDALRTHVMGNLARQGLADVWRSPAFVKARSRLEAGRRDAGPSICSSCDNRLYPLPGGSI